MFGDFTCKSLVRVKKANRIAYEGCVHYRKAGSTFVITQAYYSISVCDYLICTLCLHPHLNHPNCTSISCSALFMGSTAPCFSFGRHDKVSILSCYFCTWVTTLVAGEASVTSFRGSGKGRIWDACSRLSVTEKWDRKRAKKRANNKQFLSLYFSWSSPCFESVHFLWTERSLAQARLVERSTVQMLETEHGNKDNDNDNIPTLSRLRLWYSFIWHIHNLTRIHYQNTSHINTPFFLFSCFLFATCFGPLLRFVGTTFDKFKYCTRANLLRIHEPRALSFYQTKWNILQIKCCG